MERIKRVRLCFAIFLILLLVMPSAGYADDISQLKKQIKAARDENKALKDVIDRLIGRIEALEERGVGGGGQDVKAAVEEALDEREEEAQMDNLFEEVGLENMLFHGYADLEFKTDEFDRAGGGSREINYFDNHHFNLWFGYKMADNLLVKGEVEMEHAGEDFKLEFADIEWKPFSNDNLELLMGMILVPLGIENPVHASVWNRLISRPLVSRSIIPGTYSDIGIEARGWFPDYENAKVRYHLYVVNGLGDDDSDFVYEQSSVKRSRDNNKDKAIGGQIAVFPIKGLEIGASGYTGKWDDDGKSDTIIVGAHTIYNMDPIEFRAEYIFQQIERAHGVATQDADLYGYYLQGSYKLSGLNLGEFLDKWEIVTRYDWMANPDGVLSLKQGGIASGTYEDRIALGLVFRPQDWLQFKVEYLRRNNKEMTGQDDDGVAFQAVANW